MTILFIPIIAFADDQEKIEYTADYICDDLYLCADSWGGLVFDESADGHYVIVHTQDGDIRYDFQYSDYDNSYYIYDKEDGHSLDYYFYCEDDNYVNGYNKVFFVIDDDTAEWRATAAISNAYVYNEVSGIGFQTSETTVYSEDIKSKDINGGTYLDLDRRFIHSHEGETWPSAFAVGDKLVVHYENGRTKTFINKDYYDDGYGEWTDGFFCGDELLEKNYVNMYFEQDEPMAGDNTIEVYYMGRIATFTVIIETPESRAADNARREAEAKAKAEAEAKAKAEAEAKAKAEAAAKAKAAALKKASNINKATVSASDIRKASNLGATTITLGAKVKKIKANAFKGTKIKTITIKTKKLKAKTVKGSFKSSKVKTIIVKVGNKKANKQFVKTYKKIFTKKNVGKKVSVK